MATCFYYELKSRLIWTCQNGNYFAMSKYKRRDSIILVDVMINRQFRIDLPLPIVQLIKDTLIKEMLIIKLKEEEEAKKFPQNQTSSMARKTQECCGISRL